MAPVNRSSEEFDLIIIFLKNSNQTLKEYTTLSTTHTTYSFFFSFFFFYLTEILHNNPSPHSFPSSCSLAMTYTSDYGSEDSIQLFLKEITPYAMSKLEQIFKNLLILLDPILFTFCNEQTPDKKSF